nr:hypothetical protein [Frigoribacterium sp. RIT-PI-h]
MSVGRPVAGPDERGPALDGGQGLSRHLVAVGIVEVRGTDVLGLVVAGAAVKDRPPLLDELGGAGGDRCGAGAIVAGALHGVVELCGALARVGGQFGQDLGVVLELDQHSGLIEGEVVQVRRLRDGGALGHGEALLHLGRLGAGAASDGGGAHPVEAQLLERGDPLGLLHTLALVVLDQLLDDARCGVVVPVDDVRGDRGDACLAGGEGAALTGPDAHAALVIATGEDRHENAVRLDRRDELLIDRHVQTHVLLDLDHGGVDVLDGACGSGCHVLLFLSLFLP